MKYMTQRDLIKEFIRAEGEYVSQVDSGITRRLEPNYTVAVAISLMDGEIVTTETIRDIYSHAGLGRPWFYLYCVGCNNAYVETGYFIRDGYDDVKECLCDKCGEQLHGLVEINKGVHKLRCLDTQLSAT
jgi:hypothetical protein